MSSGIAHNERLAKARRSIVDSSEAVMAETKTKPTDVSVVEFLNAVADERQRADALVLLEMMQEITGESPRMWGPSMVGFGTFHYVYDSGHEGDMFRAGFSPRKGVLVVYFMSGVERRFAQELERLGKVKVTKGCVYIKRLADVDLAVLRTMIAANMRLLDDPSPFASCAAPTKASAPEKPPAKAKKKRSK